MSNARFELHSSQLFLTYPQCPLTKEAAYQGFLSVLGDAIEHYIVAREHHKNGDFHIHAYFALSKPYRTKCSTALDITCPDTGAIYHGNYQGCRSAKNVVKYCTKEEDYISNMDVASITSKKSTRQAICERIVKGHEALEELVQEFPQLLFGYQKLKMDLIVLQEDLKEKTTCFPSFLPNPWARYLPSFRSDKRRHYWIYSREPNFGKTFHFAIPLRDEFGAIICTGDFTYWNVKRTTECVILDDYNSAKLKWDALNQLADGTFQFRVAHRGVVNVAKYLVIILSNQSINELYPNRNQFIHARYLEIELK